MVFGKIVRCPRTGNRLDDESGQAFVELALTVPLLVLLLLGAAELARVAYMAIELSNAAKAAVQYGAQNPTTAIDVGGMQTAAQLEAPDLFNASSTTNFTVTPTHSCVCSTGAAAPHCALGDCTNSELEEVLQVNTSAQYDPLIHIPGLTNNTFTLHGQAIQKRLDN
jgi:Flp pilus assembly protein TadG